MKIGSRWFKNWYKVLQLKAEKRRKCKVNRYNCSECIYGDWFFDGVKFRGSICRLEAKIKELRND